MLSTGSTLIGRSTIGARSMTETARQAEGLLSTAESSRRLGVKPETLYAYVSRGLLHRQRSPDGRRSWFDPAEVERLAERSRQPPGRAAAHLGVTSAITSIQGGRYRYRGVDATELARDRSFEQVAHWLWTGALPAAPDWHADESAVEVGRAAQAVLPPDTLPLERLRAGIAERLWRKLTPAAPDPPLLRTLDTAMVLMADHELAASTVAARAAASVRADPYAVVSAGLAVASGTLHAGASLDIEALLAEAGRPERAARAVGERLRRGERIRGFGHFVYKDGDPRADHLLERLRAVAVERPALADRLAVAEAVLDAARRRRLPEPNVDFALATLASMAGMIAGAGEAIFVVARAAGWLAHGLEEYQRGVPIRPRATYTGPDRASLEEEDGRGGTDQDSR